jgi:hypothetical protein
LELQQKAYPDPSRSVYLPNLTLFSPVFSRLDLFCVFYLDALGFFYRRLKLLGFNRLSFASHICCTDSIPWVHHSREEGSLDYDGRLVRLRVTNEL